MKNFALIIMLISTSMVACNFSKGVKKDLTTGLSTSYNGFSLDDAYLTDENGNRLNTNEIQLGSLIIVEATGVDYYTVKDGMVFPGCTILLTDKSKNEILNLPDAFADMTEGTPASEAEILRARLTTGSPMEVGETYSLDVRFFDKNNSENEIVSHVDLVVTE